MTNIFPGFKPGVICLLTLLLWAFFFTACRQGSNGRSPDKNGTELKSSLPRAMSPVYTETELRQLVRDNNTFAFIKHSIAGSTARYASTPEMIFPRNTQMLMICPCCNYDTDS